jgi:hypothetical protein
LVATAVNIGGRAEIDDMTSLLILSDEDILAVYLFSEIDTL